MNNESWLDLLLSELGWNPEDLARASGLDPATISNIRSGRRNVGVRVAGIIADATNRTTDEVLRRAGVLKGSQNEPLDPSVRKNQGTREWGGRAGTAAVSVIQLVQSATR